MFFEVYDVCVSEPLNEFKGAMAQWTLPVRWSGTAALSGLSKRSVGATTMMLPSRKRMSSSTLNVPSSLASDARSPESWHLNNSASLLRVDSPGLIHSRCTFASPSASSEIRDRVVSPCVVGSSSTVSSSLFPPLSAPSAAAASLSAIRSAARGVAAVGCAGGVGGARSGLAWSGVDGGSSRFSLTESSRARENACIRLRQSLGHAKARLSVLILTWAWSR